MKTLQNSCYIIKTTKKAIAFSLNIYSFFPALFSSRTPSNFYSTREKNEKKIMHIEWSLLEKNAICSTYIIHPYATE